VWTTCIVEAKLFEVSFCAGYQGAVPSAFVGYGEVDLSVSLRQECLSGRYRYEGAAVGVTRALCKLFFRNEVVKFSLRSRAQNSGKNPSWTSYEKIREVIEKRILSQVEDLLPVISFGSKKDGDTEKKHGEFLQRMVGRGYTERQVRRLVEWYMRVKQAG
jgi:hypothetical protein